MTRPTLSTWSPVLAMPRRSAKNKKKEEVAGPSSHPTPKPLHTATPPATPAPASRSGQKKGGGVDWDYVATIQEVMEDDEDEEMQEQEEEDKEEMSESGYIGAKGPIVRTFLEWIQWMRKHPPAWVCETYLEMNREKNEEMDRMVGERILLKKYTDNVDEENMRLRLSGPVPKEHKEEVEKLRREVETFQEKSQLLAQENADLRDSVHHLAQMVIAGSPKTVGVDKAIQAEPTVTDKEVQTVSRTYADVLSQTEREEEEVEVKRGLVLLMTWR